MIKKLFFSFLISALFWGISNFASAVSVSVISGQGPSAAPASSPGVWIAESYKYSLILVGLLAFAVIVWAGLRYAMAAGNPSTQSDARDQILQALLGLLLLLGATIVLYTINPNIISKEGELPALPTLESVSGQKTQQQTGEQPYTNPANPYITPRK